MNFLNPTQVPSIFGGQPQTAGANPAVQPANPAGVNTVAQAANSGFGIFGQQGTAPQTPAIFGSVTGAVPALPQAPQGNALTNFFNNGKPATIVDPTTGAVVANPELYSTGDIAQGIAGGLQAGVGAYGIFKDIGFQQERLDQGRDALRLNQDQYQEQLRSKNAVIAQNRNT